MKLEQQVVSLDLAKRLKELGVKQESYFIYYPHHAKVATANRYFLQSIYDSNYDEGLWPKKYAISAFTVAELGEMLPWMVQTDNGLMYFSELTKNGPTPAVGKEWEISYTTPDGDGGHDEVLQEFVASADTEADARAKMLIYLLENKLITN